VILEPINNHGQSNHENHEGQNEEVIEKPKEYGKPKEFEKPKYEQPRRDRYQPREEIPEEKEPDPRDVGNIAEFKGKKVKL
jgi:hypothetical protein